jgi:hypothetical protein
LRQAEMLILLGRGKDAGPHLAEVERAIATKADTNAARPRRLARLHALLAATEGRFADVAIPAALARTDPGATPDSTDHSARVLAEYALAQLGRSRTPAATLALWPKEVTAPDIQRELSYWVAQTLRARGENGPARDLAQAAWAEPAGQGNPELRWRLAALAQNGATMPPRAAEDAMQALKALWSGYDSTAYFNRADLKPLASLKQER